MLDARADGKRLGRHGNAQFVQHGEGVAGAVADGEDDVLRLHLHGFASMDANRAAHLTVFDMQAGQPRFKEHFPAQAHDLLPDGAHHSGKAVRAHVGARFPEDLLRRAEAGQRFQHFAAVASLMPELSLPSEKAPAPPSPNCTLLSGSSAAPFQKAFTSRARSSTLLPRSITSGARPMRASVSAANSPAGPRTDHQRSMGKGARRGQGTRRGRGKLFAAFGQRTERGALSPHRG